MKGTSLDKEIGLRLKEIRAVFNEGTPLSAEQFAHLTGETGDKIRNYESGRTAVPPSLLMELYSRGLSPTWIVTGQGSRFAETEEGERFRKNIERRVRGLGGGVLQHDADEANLHDMPLPAGTLKVAAGRAEVDLERKKTGSGAEGNDR